MNARDELLEFQRFLGEMIDRGAQTLDEVLAEWKLHASNRPGLVCDSPLIEDPAGVDSSGRPYLISPEAQRAYELEHFLEHGHD